MRKASTMCSYGNCEYDRTSGFKYCFDHLRVDVDRSIEHICEVCARPDELPLASNKRSYCSDCEVYMEIGERKHSSHLIIWVNPNELPVTSTMRKCKGCDNMLMLSNDWCQECLDSQLANTKCNNEECPCQEMQFANTKCKCGHHMENHEMVSRCMICKKGDECY